MRNGKIPERIYSKSLNIILNKYKKSIMKGTANNGGCAFLCMKSLALSDRRDMWEPELEIALRALKAEAAVAGKPAAVQACLTLSPDMTEEDVRGFICLVAEKVVGGELFLGQLSGMVSEGTDRPLAALVIIGQELDKRATGASFHGDIVMTGYAGALGAGYMAVKYKEVLRERFSRDYIRRMCQLPPTPDTQRLMDIARSFGGRVKPVGEGGIFSALWETGAEYS